MQILFICVEYAQDEFIYDNPGKINQISSMTREATEDYWF